ncbi:MAG: AAA family ATPase [Nocardioides sp.]
MSRLIHLNGPPAVGKSTLARRYAAEHPGVLVLEIDTLRTMVAGWQEDFYEAGARIRTAALAAIQACLASGHDVVLPQLIGRSESWRGFALPGHRAVGSTSGWCSWPSPTR